MVMQISVNILIRFEGGEEVLNIVRAFGWTLPLCFILLGIVMCKVGPTEKPTEEWTSENWLIRNRRNCLFQCHYTKDSAMLSPMLKICYMARTGFYGYFYVLQMYKLRIVVKLPKS
jgi:hypothetical protein